MTRAEHLQWSKDRAIQILEKGTGVEAYTSFLSDMGKHDELSSHPALHMGMSMILGGMLQTKEDVKKYINDFN